MNLELTLQIGQLVSTLAAVAAIVVAVYTYKRQTNTLVFLEYTKRYAEVMESFPADTRGARLNLDGEPPPCSMDLTASVLRYLNLCSEEFYLCHRGYLSRDVWRIWEDELLRTLRSPLVRREWQMLKGEFASYPEFITLVDRSQSVSTGCAYPTA